MNSILEKVISEDYELVGNGRWLRTVEHDSLIIDSKKQLFFWNSKDLAGDAYTWLIKVKGYNNKEAKKRISELKDSDIITVRSFTIKGKKEDVVVCEDLVDVFWSNGKHKGNRDYWYKREIFDTTIDRFRLGHYNGWYTIPIYQDNEFKNFQIRRDLPEKKIKSWYRGVGPLLFNSSILNWISTVYITEGLTDCLILNQAGLPAISHNTGAGGWMPQWFKYFIKLKEIYVVYDNDEAGIKGSKFVAENLGVYRTKIFTFEGFGEKYDINKYFLDGGNKEDFRKLVLEKSKYSFAMERRIL